MGVHAAGHAILRRCLHDPGFLFAQPAFPAYRDHIGALGPWREPNTRGSISSNRPSSEPALALFSALNLLHGPLATISILIAFEIINFSFDAGFALWQKAIFAGTAMLFAAPTHAMVEFFSLTRDMAGPIARLSQFSEDGILPEHQSRLVSIRLRSKLFYLSIFIAGVPLVFFGVSTGFKVDHMLWTSATAFNSDQLQMLPL